MANSLVTHHLCTPSNSALELRDQLYNTNNINININMNNMDSSSSSCSSSSTTSPSSLTNPATTTQAMAMAASSCTVPHQDHMAAEPAQYTPFSSSMDHLHSSILQQFPPSDTPSSASFYSNWSNSINPAVSHNLGFHHNLDSAIKNHAQAAALAAAMHTQMQGPYNNSYGYGTSGYGELTPTVDPHPSNGLYGSKSHLFRSVSLPARAALANAKAALIHNMQPSAANYSLNQNHNLNQIPNHVISHNDISTNTNANMLYRAESCSISGPAANNLCSADQSLDNSAEVKPKGMVSTEEQERAAAIIKEETEQQQQAGAGSSSVSGKAAAIQQANVNTTNMGGQNVKANVNTTTSTITTTTTTTTRKRPRAADASSCPSAQQQLKAAHLDTPPDVVHVRARRGQATDSHSLAERVRREKISQRMKVLQEIVPGCHKVLGKAMMLDEIINYVKSLQKQVEFLSMKLAAANQVGMEPMMIAKDPTLYNEIIQNGSNFHLHGDTSCINFVGEMGSTCQQIRSEGIMPSLIQ